MMLPFSMKAARFEEVNEPLQIEEMPIPVPPTDSVRHQISLLGSYAFTKRNIEQLVDLAASGRLNLEESITHTFPLEEVNTALKYLYEKIENPIRVAVTLP